MAVLVLVASGVNAQAPNAIAPAAEAADHKADSRLTVPHTEDRLIEYLIRGRDDADSDDVEVEESASRIWNRRLPFFAQQVIDLGFDLPEPFGASLIYAYVEQDQDLRDLKVRLGDGDEQDIDFVDFSGSRTDSSSVQLKLDAWILPFMNVYALVGKIDGDGEVPFAIPVDEALKIVLPPIGALCDTQGPLRPEICDETLFAVADVDYEGDSIGLGTAIAVGWSRYFFVFNANYVVTDVDVLDDNTDTWDLSARFGVLTKPAFGDLAVFVGVNYLRAETVAVGRVSYDLSDVPEIGRELFVDYVIDQKNSEATNYIFGANLDMTRAWHVTGQVGFGGSRDQVVLGIARRF